MRRRVITSMLAAACAMALASCRPRGDDAAALAALRLELEAMRAELAAVRAEVAELRKDQPAPAVAAPTPAATAVAPAAAASGSPEYLDELARADARFAMLLERFNKQSRQDGWAKAREQEIAALKGRHEYFAQTTFEMIDCRSTWCRVIASFPNDSQLSMFMEVFHGFVPPFENATMRELRGSTPPRCEVFLSASGRLPR